MIKRTFKAVLGRLDNRALKFASMYSWSARLYYTLINSGYVRDQEAFLAGRLAYAQSLDCPAGGHALIRRNVHRIEKGLLMRPRRVPFALDYIRETVDAYDHWQQVEVDITEAMWATDVLDEYFIVHKDCSALVDLRAHYQSCRGNCTVEGSRSVPYQRDLDTPLNITINDLAALAKRRRSVRWFAQTRVPRTAIDKAIELGVQAPSACNRQPFEFRVVDDPSLVKAIVSIPFGLAGYGDNVPVICVIVGKQNNYFHERDRHLIYIDASLAVMGFLFALEVQGLSSCCVNWPDLEDRERTMAKVLNLRKYERPIMLIAIGYPDPEGLVAYSAKKSLDHIRRYNFEE